VSITRPRASRPFQEDHPISLPAPASPTRPAALVSPIGRAAPLAIPLCLAALLAGLAAPSVDARTVVDDWGSWGQFVAEGSLQGVSPSLDKTRIWVEGQSRWATDWTHWYQGMARTAIGYSLSDRATIWAGYTYLPTQNVGKPFLGQQDLWPAFRYVLPLDNSGTTLTSRTMFETNFLRGVDVRYRPRQMLRFLHPFAAEPRLSLIVWDEFFVRANTTPSGGNAGFDQNRAFAGFGWTVDKGLRAELGYLNQRINDATLQKTTSHNLVMGSVYYNF
jgi:hypothetical protein